MKNKIIFIGPLSRTEKPEGGDQFKNKILVALFQDYFTVEIVNSLRWKKNVFFFIKIINLVFFKRSGILVISVSYKSALLFIRLLHFFRYPLNQTIYFVIGGYAGKYIKQNQKLLPIISQLKCIIVEGALIKKEMDSPLLKSPVHIIPNIKQFNKNFYPVKPVMTDKFKFVFLSRIIPEKGIADIFEASSMIRANHPELDFSITFYGPLESSFSNTFKECLDSNHLYGGSLDLVSGQEESYKKLSEFGCMLFPTRYKSEGFPGVIVDAFICGLPVIATRWNMNEEIIEDKWNGLLVPPGDIKALAWAMITIMTDNDLCRYLSSNSLTCRNHYHLDAVKDRILELID